MAKPFKISARWIDYAHGPGAEDGQPLATRLTDLPSNKAGIVTVPDVLLVCEIADVAELYAGDGDEMGASAKRTMKRAIEWLRAEGVTDWRGMLKQAAT